MDEIGPCECFYRNIYLGGVSSPANYIYIVYEQTQLGMSLLQSTLFILYLYRHTIKRQNVLKG